MKFTLVLLAALCTVTSVEAALSPKCKAWKQRINTFINKMDTNHDNKVTYKEYVHYWTVRNAGSKYKNGPRLYNKWWKHSATAKNTWTKKHCWAVMTNNGNGIFEQCCRSSHMFDCAIPVVDFQILLRSSYVVFQ